jgi:hypothetical protein
MSGAFGQHIKEHTIDKLFLTGPGENLIPATLMQLSSVPGFIKLFGPYTYIIKDDQQRWADYERFDWSIRQLPTINVFEASAETKDSDQAFLKGMVNIQVFWPPNFRRGDSRRVESAFKGTLENFFNSMYVSQMLDEIYFISRPMKVFGLNEYGKTMTWTPNTMGIIDNEAVPVTSVSVNYRIDLRAWNRALVYMNRTKAQPFEDTLYDLLVIGGVDLSFNQAADNDYESSYQGIDNKGKVWVNIPDEIIL